MFKNYLFTYYYHSLLSFFAYVRLFTSSCTFLCSIGHFLFICLLVLATQKFLLTYISLKILFSVISNLILKLYIEYLGYCTKISSGFIFYNFQLSEEVLALVIWYFDLLIIDNVKNWIICRSASTIKKMWSTLWLNKTLY